MQRLTISLRLASGKKLAQRLIPFWFYGSIAAMLLLTLLGVQGLVEKGPMIIATWALVGLNILFWAFLFFLAFFEWVMNPSREGWKKVAFGFLKSSLTFAGVLGLFVALQLLANKWGTGLEKQGRMTPCQRSAETLEDSLKPTLLERLKGHPTVEEKQKLSNVLLDYLERCEQRQAEERAKLTPQEKAERARKLRAILEDIGS